MNASNRWVSANIPLDERNRVELCQQLKIRARRLSQNPFNVRCSKSTHTNRFYPYPFAFIPFISAITLHENSVAHFEQSILSHSSCFNLALTIRQPFGSSPS